MSPLWENFANASVNGWRTTIKGVTYFLARVQYASTPSGQGTAGGSAANTLHAYYSFSNSLGRFIHRFNQDGTFADSRTVGGGNSNMGWIAANDNVVAFSAGGTQVSFTTPTGYLSTGSARNVNAQAPEVSIDSSNFVYAIDNGAATVGFYKYNSTGTLQWNKSPAGLSYNAGAPDILGNTFLGTSGSAVVTHKVDSNFNYIWGRQVTNYTGVNGYAIPDNEGGAYAYAYLPTGSSAAIARILTGGTAGFGSTIGTGTTVNTAAIGARGGFTYWLLGGSSNDGYLVKINNSTGGVVWQRSFIGSGFYVRQSGYQNMSMMVDDNAVYIAGVTSTSFGTYQHAYCLKYPVDGSVTGSYNLGGPSNLVIASSSLSISNFTPTLTSPSIGITSGQAESASTYTNNAASTTNTIVKVP